MGTLTTECIGVAKLGIDKLAVSLYNMSISRYTSQGQRQMGKRQMMIRISEGLHRRAKAKAALQGKTLSEVVRELLARWETGDIELLPPIPRQGGKPEDTG
jgi:hypothetical protein